MAQQRQKQYDVDSGEDSDFDPEAEVIDGNYKKVNLPQVSVVTGQQNQDIVFKAKSKIYRWRGQWKERGVGLLKFLQNKQNTLIRVLVRAEKIHKVVVNHLLQKKDIFCKLEQLKTSNNSWTWAGYDVSDEKAQTQKFCAKFTSKEDWQKFREEFEKACQHNGKVLAELKAKEETEKEQKKY